MRRWEKKTGETFLRRLDEEVILSVGRDIFTRRRLINQLKCGNFAAAARLGYAAQKLHAKSVKELAQRIDIDDLLAIDGVGVATIYVWMCVLESVGKNPEDWVDREAKISTLCGNKSKKRKRLT